MAGKVTRTLRERFEDKFKKNSFGCWLWTGARNQQGSGAPLRYGVFSVLDKSRPFGRRQILAHRVAWELAHGPIPEDKSVLHHCDVMHCVNPDHLYLGTNDDNIADKVDRGRSCRGVNNHKAKLTEDQVREIRALAAEGMKDSQIAVIYGMQPGAIWAITKGKSWKHLP